MKEQIEEMVKSFIDGKDVPSGADCRLCLFDRDTLYIKVAEALYNAGYRKQSEVIDEFAKRLKAYPINNLEKSFTVAEIIDEVAMKMKGGEE